MNRRTFILALSLVTIFFSILYVRSRFLLIELSHRLATAQKERRELERERQALTLDLATLKSPSRIELIARRDLGLAREGEAKSDAADVKARR